jgi:hypothetical protein
MEEKHREELGGKAGYTGADVKEPEGARTKKVKKE